MIRPSTRSVILVEGASDKVALEVLANRIGRGLAHRGIAVMAMNGATNFRAFLTRYGPKGEDLNLAGLCDEAEEPILRGALSSAGMGIVEDRLQLERRGFYVCVADLEDELLRALGSDEAMAIIEREGDLSSWRLFSGQPAQSGRSVEARLSRFMGTKSGRKERYARLIVDQLDLDRQPAPLRNVLARLGVD